MVKKRKTRSADVDLLRIGHFVLLNTLIFHEVLSGQRKEVRSLRFTRKNFQSGLLSEWETIERDINYKPIFRLARLVLGALPTSRETENVLSRLKDLALSVVSSGVQLRHDLMGRIYHKLLLQTMGGYYATYYTSVPAAVLISDLLVKTDNPAWDFGDLEKVKNMRIIDPACGSGTLLASTYASIRDNFILHHPAPTGKELNALHKALMENRFYGLDVLDYAAHLTLTTLSMQNPRSRFEGSKIRTLKNGVGKGGQVFLGSLDLLGPQATLFVRNWSGSPTDERDEAIVQEIQPESFDCVVMNPPFSRSANPNLKFGYETPEVRKMMGDRLKQITDELGLQGIGVAGLGAHFIVLADKLVKKGGKMGIVIPRHILSGVSWGKVRRILFDRYTIEYLISNFDPKPLAEDHGWCWSENTDLGEVLVVARKLEQGEKPGSATYVNVTRRPSNEVESLLLSQSIRSERSKLKGSLEEGSWAELSTGGKMAGYVYSVEMERLSQNWHYPALFSHPQLNRVTLELASSKVLTPLEPFLTSRGRDISLIKRNFKPSTGKTTFAILYGHQGSMNTMSLSDDFVQYGIPNNGKASADMHRNFASDLLIAERPHINTECLLAVEVPRAVLATAFWEIKLNDEKLRSLILLWLNSTYGFLMALGAGANSEGAIFKIKQDHLGSILVPRPSPSLIKESTILFERIRKSEFRIFPQEFSMNAEGRGVRLEIDQFFSANVDLPVLSKELYELIASEPALTGKRREDDGQQGDLMSFAPTVPVFQRTLYQAHTDIP